jgi:hypothetical protein
MLLTLFFASAGVFALWGRLDLRALALCAQACVRIQYSTHALRFRRFESLVRSVLNKLNVKAVASTTRTLAGSMIVSG